MGGDAPDAFATTLTDNPGIFSRRQTTNDERVEAFYPSLFVNLGQTYELLGDEKEARRYYDLAAERGLVHRREVWDQE